jgi:hypothetical protein
MKDWTRTERKIGRTGGEVNREDPTEIILKKTRFQDWGYSQVAAGTSLPSLAIVVNGSNR